MRRNLEIEIKRLEIFVFRAPIDTPVKTAFGAMNDRPAVLLRIEDKDGAYGWGEVWCNFPGCGAEHRARLLEETFSQLFINCFFNSPLALFQHLTKATHVLAIQTGEEGPLSQVIAGIDIAAWDLVARRSGLPVYKLLGKQKNELLLPVYASGINPDNPLEVINCYRQMGYRSFKLKIGFNETSDLHNVESIAQGLSKNEQLMVDANQAWNLETAKRVAKKLEKFPLSWLEEPLKADRPIEEWTDLANTTKTPLAVGENIRGENDYFRAIDSKCFKVIQPDVCKWGGISDCLPVAKEILSSGIRYCPHYLGGGIGLMASAHLLAAAGGDGLLEVDANDNPLKEGLAQPFPKIKEGCFVLKPQPGLGVEPDLSIVKIYLCNYKDIS